MKVEKPTEKVEAYIVQDRANCWMVRYAIGNVVRTEGTFPRKVDAEFRLRMVKRRLGTQG